MFQAAQSMTSNSQRATPLSSKFPIFRSSWTEKCWVVDVLFRVAAIPLPIRLEYRSISPVNKLVCRRETRAHVEPNLSNDGRKYRDFGARKRYLCGMPLNYLPWQWPLRSTVSYCFNEKLQEKTGNFRRTRTLNDWENVLFFYLGSCERVTVTCDKLTTVVHSVYASAHGNNAHASACWAWRHRRIERNILRQHSPYYELKETLQSEK